MQKLFKLLLIAAFFNSLAWITLIPIWQYPDEQAHFAQVQGLAEFGSVPNTGPDTSLEIALSEKVLGTERDGFGNNKYTYHPEYNIQYSENWTGLLEREISNLPRSSRTDLVKRESTHNPPLYYIIGSLFYKVFAFGNIIERVYAVRLFSMILFMFQIYMSYKIVKLIFEKNEFLSYALPSLIAFKPMLIFASTGILPDPLTNLLFTVVIFLSLLIIEKGVRLSYLFLGIIMMIIGSLTRQQFLISLPIITIAILFRVFLEQRIKIIVPLLFFTLSVFSLGFIFPPFIYLRGFSLPEIASPDISLLFSKDFIVYLKTFLGESNNQTFAWYWGVYRWLSLTLPSVVYQIIKVVILISLTGILIKIVGDLFKKRIRENLSFYFLISTALIYAAVIIVWNYYFRLDHGYSFGIQGRYYFPIIVPTFVLILTGFYQILSVFKRYINVGIWFLVFLMILANDFSLAFVASSYYDTSNLYTFMNQASQYKPLFLKGNTTLIILTVAITLQVVFVFRFAKYLSKTYESHRGNRL